MIDFDQDFYQRWTETPAIVRQVILNDLARLEQLLEPETDFETWKMQELKSRLQSNQMIEQSYLDIKQNLKLTQKNLLQLVLEKKLAKKRADELAMQQRLQQDEIQQNFKQMQMLQHINTQVQQESEHYAQRYTKVRPNIALDTTGQHYIDNLRLGLELESEAMIQQAVQEYRNNLRKVAQEEIDFLVKEAEKKQDKSTKK